MISLFINDVARGSGLTTSGNSAARLTFYAGNGLLALVLAGSDVNQGDIPNDLVWSFRQQNERSHRVCRIRLRRSDRAGRVLEPGSYQIQ